jgi:hypothetical protein
LDNWDLTKKQKDILGQQENKLQNYTIKLSNVDNKNSDNEQSFKDFETKLQETIQQNIANIAKQELAVNDLSNYIVDLKAN